MFVLIDSLPLGAPFAVASNALDGEWRSTDEQEIAEWWSYLKMVCRPDSTRAPRRQEETQEIKTKQPQNTSKRSAFGIMRLDISAWQKMPMSWSVRKSCAADTTTFEEFKEKIVKSGAALICEKEFIYR